MPMQPQQHELRLPQIRVLLVLVPTIENSPEFEWPTYKTTTIAEKMGVSLISDSVRRAIYGLPSGSSSGTPHPGLLDLKLIKKQALVLDGGVVEANYQITAAGISALKRFLAENKGVVPKARKKESCINSRYASGE